LVLAAVVLSIYPAQQSPGHWVQSFGISVHLVLRLGDYERLAWWRNIDRRRG
jgi:hypothetical protein